MSTGRKNAYSTEVQSRLQDSVKNVPWEEQGTLPNEDMKPFPLEENGTTEETNLLFRKRGEVRFYHIELPKSQQGGSAVGLGEPSGAQAEQPSCGAPGPRRLSPLPQHPHG